MAVIVHQRKRRAVHILFPPRPEPGNNAFDERRLAAPEFPFQQHDAPGLERPGQLSTESHRFFGRVRDNVKKSL